ncbi:MAG: SDR family oxidoreductase [Raineya sp.]|nr:SDR family oxidoreductase [Raineya sp.]
MQKFFQDKVILITGASSGIGRALSEKLAQMGAIIYNADLQKPSQNLPNIIFLPLDVRNFEQFQAVFQEILQKHNRIDILINNAGIGVAGEAQDLDLSAWQKVIDTNLWGVIHGSKIAYDLMIKQGFGHIVNMASMSALISFPLAIPYATAKHGVLGLSKSLRVEGAGFGVKVTAICPGFVESALYDNAIKSHTDTQKIKSTIPFPILRTEKAVQYILKGIVKNKGVVIFPFYTRLTMWLERLFPNLVSKFVLQKAVKDFRKNKI